MLSGFERMTRGSGGDGRVDTPVPIPNTEVKHSYGENSWACPSEDNELPGFDSQYCESFFCLRDDSHQDDVLSRMMEYLSFIFLILWIIWYNKKCIM